MIVEDVRYKIDPAQRQAFVECYRNASEQLDASEFCRGYELTECEEEEGQYVLRIEWTSAQDHINGFRKSPVFPAFFANVKPFFNHIQEMRHYNLTEVVRKK